ncbi:hypothetical protein [Streptomyces sp. NRRL S-31]|uniref:hypothetical protein n=1 Tax=Streptomyces sp. NRRL S-31 TaxID=1463898 RepID=UPI000A3EC9FA|nr:hypothetical protein [Streptomyces sp. NRRL S-31]
MFGKKNQQSTDLTSPENVAKGQKIYDRIERGQCKHPTAELHATFGTKPKKS